MISISQTQAAMFTGSSRACRRHSRRCADRPREPGKEMSFGNAGLIQREAMIPYTFPEFGIVLSYAINNRRDAIYHLSALPRIAPWVFQYWRNAIPERVEQSMQALAPLMAQCKEHDALIPEVGGAAQSPVNHRGWLKLPRRQDAAQGSRGRA